VPDVIIINTKGINTGRGASDESGWGADYFPAMYSGDWTPSAGVGFFVGHKDISGKKSYLEFNTGRIGGWTITQHYLYNLASGTPESAPNGGIVLSAKPASHHLGLKVYDTTPNLRVNVGKIDSTKYGILVNDNVGSEVFAAYGTVIRIAGASGWTFDKDGYITGAGGTLRTQLPVADSGTSTSVGSGFLTDTSKSWITDEHDGAYLKDSAGVYYEITSNTDDTVSISGTPASGAYSIRQQAVVIDGVLNRLSFYHQGNERLLLTTSLSVGNTTTNVGLKINAGSIKIYDTQNIIFDTPNYAPGTPPYPSSNHHSHLFETTVELNNWGNGSARYYNLYSDLTVDADSETASTNLYRWVAFGGVVENKAEDGDSLGGYFRGEINNALNPNDAIGVFGSAKIWSGEGSGHAWAGYFEDGDVYIENKLIFKSWTGSTVEIVFGSDVNLYRSAANVLKTDDSFDIVGSYKMDGSDIIDTNGYQVGVLKTQQCLLFGYNTAITADNETITTDARTVNGAANTQGYRMQKAGKVVGVSLQFRCTNSSDLTKLSATVQKNGTNQSMTVYDAPNSVSNNLGASSIADPFIFAANDRINIELALLELDANPVTVEDIVVVVFYLS